jgi:hypothetical protein
VYYEFHEDKGCATVFGQLFLLMSTSPGIREQRSIKNEWSVILTKVSTALYTTMPFVDAMHCLELVSTHCTDSNAAGVVLAIGTIQ